MSRLQRRRNRLQGFLMPKSEMNNHNDKKIQFNRLNYDFGSVNELNRQQFIDIKTQANNEIDEDTKPKQNSQTLSDSQREEVKIDPLNLKISNY